MLKSADWDCPAIIAFSSLIEQLNKGIYVYGGSMAHPDGIRSVTNTLTALEAQSKTVSFTQTKTA